MTFRASSDFLQKHIYFTSHRPFVLLLYYCQGHRDQPMQLRRAIKLKGKQFPPTDVSVFCNLHFCFFKYHCKAVYSPLLTLLYTQIKFLKSLGSLSKDWALEYQVHNDCVIQQICTSHLAIQLIAVVITHQFAKLLDRKPTCVSKSIISVFNELLDYLQGMKAKKF